MSEPRDPIRNGAPGLFDEVDPEAEAAADARALTDIEAGRILSHDAVKRWIESWRADNPLPRPRPDE